MGNKYSSVESAHCLKVQKLVDMVRKEILSKDKDISKEDFLKVSHEMLRRFRINDQGFEFSSSPNNLGGVRWYALCPKCGKKSLKLYLPVKKSEEDLYYGCKDCHNLKSPSALMGPTKMYREVLRPLKRMDQLRELLNNAKNLPDRKIAEYLNEYDGIKAKLENSSQFRLYKFRKEHGQDPISP